MPGSTIVFFILAAVAVATALGTILSRNAVYAAMFLVLNFATVAVLYLILGAPFIALSQITVYAGSIMVLFLFVIMLLGAERLPQGEALRWQPLVAIPLGVILVIVLVVNLTKGMMPSVAAVAADYGAPDTVGKLLFTQYQLPFEVTGVILLVAVVGAIMLAKPDRISPRSKAGRRYIQANSSAPVSASPKAVTGTETAPSTPEETAPEAETAEVKSAGEK